MKRKQLFCAYCKRRLAPPQPEIGLSLTRDHVMPLAHGGYRRVFCCRTCNMLKGDLDAGDWFWFISCHPRWWKTFDHAVQVEDVVRRERVARAWARYGASQ